MRLQSLKHLLEAAQACAKAERIFLVGLAALLPSHPELGEPGAPLALTPDADLLAEPIDEAVAGVLQEALGEAGAFTKNLATIRMSCGLPSSNTPGRLAVP